MRAKHARAIRIGVVQGLRDRDAIDNLRKGEDMIEFRQSSNWELSYAAWIRTFKVRITPRMPRYGWRDK